MRYYKEKELILRRDYNPMSIDLWRKGLRLVLLKSLIKIIKDFSHIRDIGIHNNTFLNALNSKMAKLTEKREVCEE